MANEAKSSGGGGGGPSSPGNWGGGNPASEKQVAYMNDLKGRSGNGDLGAEAWQSLGGQTALRDAIKEKHPNADRDEISAIRDRARQQILRDADRYVDNLDMAKVSRDSASRMISYLKRGRTGRVDTLIWSNKTRRVMGAEARPDYQDIEDFMRRYAR